MHGVGRKVTLLVSAVIKLVHVSRDSYLDFPTERDFRCCSLCFTPHHPNLLSLDFLAGPLIVPIPEHVTKPPVSSYYRLKARQRTKVARLLEAHSTQTDHALTVHNIPPR